MVDNSKDVLDIVIIVDIMDSRDRIDKTISKKEMFFDITWPCSFRV